jgi:hypothetical protein
VSVSPDYVAETREMLLARARDAMSLAEAEPLPNRARIHLAAAETWRKLAARKQRRECVPALPHEGLEGAGAL